MKLPWSVKRGNGPPVPPLRTFRTNPAADSGSEAAEAAAYVPYFESGGQFVPFFQPRIRLRDGAVVGFEALARWCASDGTIVPPALFLPRLTGTLERTTLLLRMLDGVIAQGAAWRGRAVDLP